MLSRRLGWKPSGFNRVNAEGGSARKNNPDSSDAVELLEQLDRREPPG
jgi:hypothetical protein